MKRYLLMLVFLFLMLIALGNYLFGLYHANSTFEQIRQKLMLIASSSTVSISTDEVLKVPLEQRSEGTADYMVIYDKLVKIKEANPAFIKYVYIMTATDQPGILQYVVDADPVPEIITAKCPTSLPGDQYDARKQPEMLNAYNGPSADKKITSDEWGVFISGYAPIRDESGKTVAILGVDTGAEEVDKAHQKLKQAGFVLLLTVILFLMSFVSLVRFPSLFSPPPGA